MKLPTFFSSVWLGIVNLCLIVPVPDSGVGKHFLSAANFEKEEGERRKGGRRKKKNHPLPQPSMP